jgi:hypothetical protein
VKNLPQVCLKPNKSVKEIPTNSCPKWKKSKNIFLKATGNLPETFFLKWGKTAHPSPKSARALIVFSKKGQTNPIPYLWAAIPTFWIPSPILWTLWVTDFRGWKSGDWSGHDFTDHSDKSCKSCELMPSLITQYLVSLSLLLHSNWGWNRGCRVKTRPPQTRLL